MPVYTQKKGAPGGSNPQTPVGTVDGVNATFTITAPLNNLFVNEGFQTPNIDYTSSQSGGTITIVFTVPPVPGSVIYAT